MPPPCCKGCFVKVLAHATAVSCKRTSGMSGGWVLAHEGAARGEDICKVVRAHQGRRPLVWLPTPGTERLDRSTFGLARDRKRYKAPPPQGNQGLCKGATLGYVREVKKCQHAAIESHRLRHPFFRHVRSAMSLSWLKIWHCFRRRAETFETEIRQNSEEFHGIPRG